MNFAEAFSLGVSLDLAFFQQFFLGAQPIVMGISIVMLIFLLFSYQILGKAKVSEGKGQTASGVVGQELHVFISLYYYVDLTLI